MDGGIVPDYGNLKPAKKGEVRNPKGRNQHSVPEDIKELARLHCPAALRKVIKLISSKDERIALAAAKEILDRGYGKGSLDEDAARNSGVEINIIRLEQPQEPARVIDHDDHAAEQRLAAPTVSIRTVGVSTERREESGSGLPSEMGQG